jgi:transposase
MKKDSTKENAAIREVAGLDLGDKHSQLCVLDRCSGETLEESRLATTAQALRRRFEGVAPMRIGLEVGTHSPWVSRLLEQLGHEVLVANARKLRLIYKNRRKTDKVDAEYLARLARVDPELLHPLQHRGEQAQSDLAVLRSRDALVKVRTQLVNHVRGAVKSLGHRLPKCTAKGFARKVADELPAPLRPALTPLLETLSLVNEQIKAYDRELEQTLVKKYPESELLLQVRGVGPVTALAYLLILEDPERFAKSRSVGAYLGLVPATNESGESSPELHITKEGDVYLRRLLVGCAHYILGPFGQDCDLRRYGERIAQRGGKNAKKRAAVAVARKLAVLLHRLWRNGEVYDPFHDAQHAERRKRTA